MDYVGIFLDASTVSQKTPRVACALADAMKIAVQDGNVALYQKYGPWLTLALGPRRS